MVQSSTRYFAFTKRSIKGPFHPKDIAQLPGFGRSTLVCPEAALGQWREAHLEEPFQALLALPQAPPPQPQAPRSGEEAENRALRPMLEKAILKNSQLENEVKGLKREYAQQRRRVEDELRKRDAEVRTLAEKLKRAETAAGSENPSWEQLYKTLKKRSDEKLFETAEQLAEKREEVQRLKSQIQNMVDTYENSKRDHREREFNETRETAGEIAALRSALEEKETVVRTMAENMQSVLRKNEELQRIMLDERNDHDAQNLRFCEEIGSLKGELKRKQQEIDLFRTELREAVEKLRGLESEKDLKNREQDELYGVIHAKVRILTGYFDNLESRLKYAFKKA
ncbi:MAG TPA: hypothetical protein PL037_04035 [Elusimicrobiales bacterium]|nr:hypothetical protein [Elusimicrobiales bacterium]